MKWMVIFSAATLMLAGCGSKRKQENSSTASEAPPVSAPSTPMAPPVDDDNPAKVTCSKGKETRLLEIVKKGKGCAFAYTKFGKTNEAATSSHGLKHCRDSQKKVRSKLESAGYACNT